MIFAVAYCVHDPFGKFVYHVGASFGPSREEVIGDWTIKVKEMYPTKEGYYDHSVDAIQIPDDWIKKAGALLG
jgi:hypothetical protein